MILDLTTLNDGDIVIVTEDITNPSPDKRTKYDWRLAETIKAGTKLKVRIKTAEFYGVEAEMMAALHEAGARMLPNGETVLRFALEPLSGGTYDLAYGYNGEVRGLGTDMEQKTDKLAHALLEVLKPLGDDLPLGDLLRQKGIVGKHVRNRCDNLLAVLLDHGKITMADVKMAITIEDSIDYDNGDWDTFTKKHAL